MAATSHSWLPLWLLVVYFSSYGQTEKCNPVSLADVKAAVEASSSIYGAKGELKVGSYIPGTSYKVVQVATPSLKEATLKAIVATSGTDTLICFRGTVGFKQLIQIIQATIKPGHPFMYGGNVMYVMKYFWKAFKVFYPETLVPGGIVSGRKYIITGHSLGGALASLYSIFAKINKKGLWTNPRSSLITFGAPRIGDRNFAEFHDKMISPDRKLRFINLNDAVPHLPLKPWYGHHSREVWMWQHKVFGHWVKNWSVCQDGDNPPGCSAEIDYKEIFSHSVSGYRNAIINGPEVYLDQNGGSRESFEASQCR